MWILYFIVLHTLLLGSIFVIYFRSQVLTNLQPQPPLSLEAPALRLVLFVADGLRAESFFYNNCEDIPHLKQLMLTKNGLVGISHTRVPTESRPGHIALIAGLYEDPSAVTKGWKENPIDFDTVFNRSLKTYAWGAHDVLHIFSRLSREDEKRLLFDSYSHELDFSGNAKTYELDMWVFERCEKVLKRKYREIRDEKQVIFFLHLLGLDTAGHVHKPGSKLFLENLRYTEEGVRRMYDHFESLFADGKTVYILTSDHGMTNAGSHGAGEAFETETPFFMWGAGINSYPYKTDDTFYVGPDRTRPLFRMEQAQMAPLMSALLGIAVPMNNFGILPKDFLNASSEYKLRAAENNALQLVEQFKALEGQHEKGLLTHFLPKYDLNVDAIKTSIQKHKNLNNPIAATDEIYSLMNEALHGINYYFSYYRWPLLVATLLTYLGFLGHLLKLLASSQNSMNTTRTRSKRSQNKVSSVVISLGFLILTLCILQKVSWSITLYILLPVVVWYLFLTSKEGTLYLSFNVKQLFLIVACCELLVYAFFERRAISIGFIHFSLFEKFTKSWDHNKFKNILSLMLSLSLAMFPLLPPSVGYSNNLLLYLGIFFTAFRPSAIKIVLNPMDVVGAYIALFNAVICIYMHSHQWEIPLISQLISWTFLAYVLFALLRPFRTSIKHRLEMIIFLLTSLYSLLCTSYESLFLLLLISELILSVDPIGCNKPQTLSSEVSQSFRFAFAMLLYTLFSFFGTGNIASISSFDPNIIRCFLSTFSPFVIMFLVILKLIIPLLLIMSIIFALNPLAVRLEKQIFICLLIICDIMGLNFLFLVRNQGSWLEIGSSISHFVIMHVTTVVLALFVYISKTLLKISPSNQSTNDSVNSISKKFQYSQ